MGEQFGKCIVCGERTTNRVRVPARRGSRPYSHWRCPPEEFDQCADRRDGKRRRPKHRDPNLERALAVLATSPSRSNEGGEASA